MKLDRQVRISLLAAALGVASAAYGQAPPDPAGVVPGEQVAPTFDSIDLNQDSLISEQEATSARAMTPEAFSATDTNQDGYLTREEFDQGA
ncbi:hypothetical protein BH24PSE2_BH24PSE2_09140 [soil metagenome]